MIEILVGLQSKIGTPPGNTASFTGATALITIGVRTFQNTGFSTIDLTQAGTLTSASARTQPLLTTWNLTIGQDAFTNLANLTIVKLPNLANNNATLSKLGNFSKAGATQDWTIQFGADAATDSPASFTLSNSDSFSNPNFVKFGNDTLEFKLGSTDSASATLNIGQNFLFGNTKVKNLKLERTVPTTTSEATTPAP